MPSASTVDHMTVLELGKTDVDMGTGSEVPLLVKLNTLQTPCRLNPAYTSLMRIQLLTIVEQKGRTLVRNSVDIFTHGLPIPCDLFP